MFRRIIIIILALIFGLILGAGIYFYHALRETVSKDSQTASFTFNEGTSTKQLATQLYDEHFIRSRWAFIAYVKIRNQHLLSGRYALSPSMTIPEVIDLFTSGDVETTKVMFPEGWRLTQIADRLDAKGLIKKADFLKAAEGQEGYLFPDTYNFPMNITAQEIIKIMRDNFHKRTTGLKVTPDTLIIASIIEREARKGEDRPIVASVYTNRLKSGMRLEADPTVQYAKGSWASLTIEDYRSVQSPYNTYLQAGLPPGPICNPGLASITAALNPTQTDYYYFFHTADGKTIYSKTLEEHNQNKRQYLR